MTEDCIRKYCGEEQRLYEYSAEMVVIKQAI